MMGNPPKSETTDEKPGSGKERRKQERFACKGFAEVVLEEVAFLFRGTIRDLSLTGCYVQSSARLMLDAGAAVELKFSVNRDELLLPARIVAIRHGSGACFEFFDIGRDMQGRLASLISKLANPAYDEPAFAANSATEGRAAGSEARDLWH
jgi:hypothetical protein